MGSCFSIHISCETLITRCYDYAVEQAGFACKLKHNCKALKTAVAELKEVKGDVTGRVMNEEGPGVKRLEQVQGWISRAEAKITEADKLIEECQQRTETSCVGGGCCTNDYKFGYALCKKMATMLKEVEDLKQKGSFEQVVVKTSAGFGKVQDKLQELLIEREELQALKEDVMRRVHIEELRGMRRYEQVRVWASRAEDIIAQVDELLWEQSRSQEIEVSSLSFLEIVDKLLRELVALKAKGQFEIVAETALADIVIEKPSEITVGLETMLDQVWRYMSDDNVGIVGILGMGGVGKTTLLTQINNKFLLEPLNFDVVIWITVSKHLNLSKIQDDIWQKFSRTDGEWSGKSSDDKTNTILKVLREKKFVLLLDDVWKKVDLTKIGVPLPRTQKGSKVVFTTRSEEVCGQMNDDKRINVEPLKHEKAWELFREIIGENALNVHPDIRSLAQDITRDCDGLPIAIITTARAMAGRKIRQEWEYALEVLKKSTSNIGGMEEEVFPILKFSYDSLPNDQIRSCFLYCALFPEDFKIPKDDLIDYWMCEEFWDAESNPIFAHNKGHNIIYTLIRASLLEDEGKYVKMHDVIRDMALWITSGRENGNDKFLVQAGDRLKVAPHGGKWETIRRLSLRNNYIHELTEVPTCSNLSTLLLCYNSRMRTIKDDFFHMMGALNVLDLSHNEIQELPESISLLVALQYLNVSFTNIKNFPPELKRLVKLKYLNLENTFCLVRIPRDVIGSFSSLQVLRMLDCGPLLNQEVVSGSNMTLEELQGLNNLNTFSITIRGLSTLKRFLATSKLLKSTQVLSLECFSDRLDVSFLADTKQLSKLLIHNSQGLEELNLNTEILPATIFNSLTEVSLFECDLSHLTLLILMQNLTVVSIENCSKMEHLINDEKLREVAHTDKNQEPFTRLEVLKLTYLPALKSIYGRPLSFPCLKKISLVDCPLLTKLPLSRHSAKGCNLVIKGKEKWWNKLEWDDIAAKTTFATHFIH